jgi:peptidase M1-like protein
VLIAVVAGAGVTGCGHHSDTPGPQAHLGPDRIAYDLSLRHKPGRLDGSETISFRNPFSKPIDHVWIRTWANAFGSCAKPRIRLRGAQVSTRRRGCTAQRIELEQPVAAGATGKATFRFALTVPTRFDRFGRYRGIDFLGNALPVLAVSRGGAEPELPPYTFRGEAFYSLAADWHVLIRTAPGERIAATGIEARPGDLVAKNERDFMLVIGPMQQIDTRAGGVRVRWWARDRPSRAGLRIAARSIAALQRDLGSYGAEEFDGVQTPARIARGGIAMEYPQLILSPAYAPAVTHETAHQWFYRLVGNDEWSDPWADETLTSFAAVRLGRPVNGPNRLKGCAEHHRTPKPPAPLTSDMGTLERAERKRAHTIRDTLYIEGPCMLFELQRKVGRARMTAFLRDLVADHRNGVLTGEELSRRLSELRGQ